MKTKMIEGITKEKGDWFTVYVTNHLRRIMFLFKGSRKQKMKWYGCLKNTINNDSCI